MLKTKWNIHFIALTRTVLPLNPLNLLSKQTYIPYPRFSVWHEQEIEILLKACYRKPPHHFPHRHTQLLGVRGWLCTYKYIQRDPPKMRRPRRWARGSWGVRQCLYNCTVQHSQPHCITLLQGWGRVWTLLGVYSEALWWLIDCLCNHFRCTHILCIRVPSDDYAETLSPSIYTNMRLKILQQWIWSEILWVFWMCLMGHIRCKYFKQLNAMEHFDRFITLSIEASNVSLH